MLKVPAYITWIHNKYPLLYPHIAWDLECQESTRELNVYCTAKWENTNLTAFMMLCFYLCEWRECMHAYSRRLVSALRFHWTHHLRPDLRTTMRLLIFQSFVPFIGTWFCAWAIFFLCFSKIHGNFFLPLELSV